MNSNLSAVIPVVGLFCLLGYRLFYTKKIGWVSAMGWLLFPALERLTTSSQGGQAIAGICIVEDLLLVVAILNEQEARMHVPGSRTYNRGPVPKNILTTYDWEPMKRPEEDEQPKPPLT